MMSEPIVPDTNGVIGILNVGHGDTKIVFDKDNPQECIRAARIITDMLRHGYALLVEVEQSDGSKKFQRVYEFKEESFEYIIADLDPVVAKESAEAVNDMDPLPYNNEEANDKKTNTKMGKARTKRISVHQTRGVAIARTAGG